MPITGSLNVNGLYFQIITLQKDKLYKNKISSKTYKTDYDYDLNANEG